MRRVDGREGTSCSLTVELRHRPFEGALRDCGTGLSPPAEGTNKTKKQGNDTHKAPLFEELYVLNRRP